MGMFDSVNVPCPKCGKTVEAQSKGGDCSLADYEWGKAPEDVMGDVNRHAPFKCSACGIFFQVKFLGYEVVEVPEPGSTEEGR